MSYFTAFIGMSIGAGLLAVTNVITVRQNKRLRREHDALSELAGIMFGVIRNDAGDWFMNLWDACQDMTGDNGDTAGVNGDE